MWLGPNTALVTCTNDCLTWNAILPHSGVGNQHACFIFFFFFFKKISQFYKTKCSPNVCYLFLLLVALNTCFTPPLNKYTVHKNQEQSGIYWSIHKRNNGENLLGSYTEACSKLFFTFLIYPRSSLCHVFLGGHIIPFDVGYSQSPLDCKKMQSVHPKRDQSWVFIGRTDAEAETPVLWPPHAKSWLTGKDLDAGKDWGQEEKGMTEDEMAGWHHQLDGHEFE